MARKRGKFRGLLRAELALEETGVNQDGVGSRHSTEGMASKKNWSLVHAGPKPSWIVARRRPYFIKFSIAPAGRGVKRGKK